MTTSHARRPCFSAGPDKVYFYGGSGNAGELDGLFVLDLGTLTGMRLDVASGGPGAREGDAGLRSAHPAGLPVRRKAGNPAAELGRVTSQQDPLIQGTCDKGNGVGAHEKHLRKE